MSNEYFCRGRLDVIYSGFRRSNDTHTHTHVSIVFTVRFVVHENERITTRSDDTFLITEKKKKKNGFLFSPVSARTRSTELHGHSPWVPPKLFLHRRIFIRYYNNAPFAFYRFFFFFDVARFIGEICCWQ